MRLRVEFLYRLMYEKKSKVGIVVFTICNSGVILLELDLLFCFFLFRLIH